MFLVALSFVFGIVSSETTVILQTSLGKIKGLSLSFSHYNTTYEYLVFKKIPYAQPPINDLRFREPKLYGSWNGTLDATKFGPSCIQIRYPQFDIYMPNLNQSEDCLLLNIYVPKDASSTNKKSVMLWIHGGGFQIGQGMLYDGSYLATIGDVIVVTINYRLEALGFFSSGDHLAPGNYGLWDQNLAIQWVNKYIMDFGGDPNSLTIFGQSAGGLSVGLQALYPGNNGLFRRIIAQSGVGNSVLAIKQFPSVEALELVQLVNCSNTLSVESIDCLRNKSVQEIHNANMIILSKLQGLPDVHTVNPFAPVVDGKFLEDTPSNILNGSSAGLKFYKSLDVIIGNCDAEGLLLVDSLVGRHDVNVTVGILSDFLCKYIIPTLSTDYYSNNSQITPAICDKYKTDGLIQNQSQNSTNYYADVFFLSPAVSSLNVHSLKNSNASSFQYINKRYTADFSSSVDWLNGARHGSELFYLFPKGLLFNATSDDNDFINTVIKYWSNFAKTGNVNGHGMTKWPQYDDKQEYAVLDLQVTTENHLYKDRMNFWLYEIPKLLKIGSSTHDARTNGCYIAIISNFSILLIVFVACVTLI